ncbi:MAG: hypothetical protein U0441_23485 [Polyangiaceae bacterium]
MLVRDVNDQMRCGQVGGEPRSVPPEYSVVGTAITYRLALLWTADMTATPAMKGRNLIPDLAKYATLFAKNGRRQERRLLTAGERLWALATELCTRPSLRLKANAPNRDIQSCRASMALARFDQLYRTGAVPFMDPEVFARWPLSSALRHLVQGNEEAAWEALGASDEMVGRLGSMVAWFLESSSLWLHPRARAFPVFAGSDLVQGADGDLLIANMLVELKCSWKPRPIHRREVLQLLSYVLLDFEDELGIRDVSFVIPTHKARFLASVDEMFGFLSGKRRALSEWRSMFREVLSKKGAR